MSKITKKDLNERLLLVETLLGLHRERPEQVSLDKANAAIFRMQWAVSRGKEMAEPKPPLKQLDQSVFEGQPKEFVTAHVNSFGKAHMSSLPIDAIEPSTDVWKVKEDARVKAPTCLYRELKGKFDTTNWQNSAIERERKELTGSDLCRAMLARGDSRVVCLVSDTSDDHATNYRELTVLIEGFSTRDGFWDSRSTDYSHAVPVSPATNEPLTAKDAGL